MSVSAAIRRLMDAGFTLDQALLAAEVMEQEIEPVRIVDEQAERKRAADRDRMRAKRSAMSRDSGDKSDSPSLSSPEVSPQTPFPKPHLSIPPSAPKGASSPAETDLAFDAWDEMAQASGLAKARVRSPARRKLLTAILRQHGIETWREACRRVGASSFCRGEKGDGWRADLDFVLKPKSFGRILEGHYDDRPNARGSPSHQPQPKPDHFKAYAEELDGQDRSQGSDSRYWDDAQGVSILTIDYERR